MKRIREVVLKSYPPNDINVLWLDSTENTIKVYDDGAWVPYSVGSTVSTDEIEDGAVTTDKIADKSVTGIKIADNAITITEYEGEEGGVNAYTYDIRINDADTEEEGTLIGTISIPRDKYLKDARLSDMNATLDEDGNIVDGDPAGDTALVLSYYTQDGTYRIVKLDYQKFLEETEYGEGLIVTDHIIKVRLDDDEETQKWMSVSDDGIKLSGLTDAFNEEAEAREEADTTLQANIDAEAEIRQEADETLQNNIENEASIRETEDNELQAQITQLEEDLSNHEEEAANTYATLQLVVNLHANITFSANRTVIYKGESDTVTLSHSATFDGNPLTYTLTVDGAALANPYTLEDSHTFTGVFSIDNDDPDVAMDITRTVTVNAYYPRYYGYLASATITGSDVTSLTKQARASSAAISNLSVTFATSGYLWLCVPSGMTVSNVTSSGFAVPMESPVTVSVDGKGDYLCYRSTNEALAGTVTYTVS